jgi:FkbM family methyltransferase
MLISLSDILTKFHVDLKGIIHIGAHLCEEFPAYKTAGLSADKVLWIEGNPMVAQNAAAIHKDAKIITAVLGDIDDKNVSFIVTNNGQSSSILEMGKHKQYHPHIHEVSRFEAKTRKLDSLLKELKIDPSCYNFMNLDIQGAELLALKGAEETLKNISYIYTEVNDQEIYVGCALIEELDKFLGKLGYTRLMTSMTEYHWGDAFYSRTTKSAVDVSMDTKVGHWIESPTLQPLKIPSWYHYYGYHILAKPMPLFNDNCDPYTNGLAWLWNQLRGRVKVVFDVGTGGRSLFTSESDTPIQLHCFEPNPDMYLQLKSQANQHTFINGFGIGIEEGKADYYTHSMSIMPRAHYKCTNECKCKISVELRRLDKYITSLSPKITGIDFLDVYTEGYDLKVLESLGSYINSVKMIMFGYGGTYPDNKVTLAQVYKFLQAHGFTHIYLLCPGYLYRAIEPIENYRYSNWVACRSAFHKTL